MKGIIPPTDTFAYPTLALDVDKALDWLKRCRDRGVQYGLGAKVPKHGDETFTRVDCSGAVREMIWLMSGWDIGDGSVQQHEKVRASKFKVSSVPSALANDNIMRIAFLSPANGGGVGHVALIFNGKTLESHGGLGPDRRTWTGAGWQGKTQVYVLGGKV